MSKAISTLLELRRRKVFRGIGYYLVGAWTLLQVAEVVLEPAGLPSWSLTALLYFAVVGFPLAVWMAWRYELTDHGLVRTRPATEADSKADYSLKTSDYIIFGAMVAVIAAIAWQGLSNIRLEAVQTESSLQAEAEAQREALENSVAVLPFSDLSQSADQAYLGDGIADTVLHVLSQVKGLTVSSRTSSFAFRSRNLTVQEIAKELGVAHVLEGSVQSAGGQLRIIARLINAKNGRELWSRNFDREPSEIFAIQDEIAREVVAALQVTVLDDDRERIATEYQPVLQAYEQYVLGKRELDSGTVPNMESAKARFEKAIKIDPDYALAYTALARATRSVEMSKGPSGFAEMRQETEELVERALDLDPALAEAWTIKAMLYAEDKEFEKGGDAVRKALELNPNSAEAWHGYWNYLLLTGDRQEEALDAIRRAVELDPESASYQSSLAQQLFNLKRAEEAIYVLRENVRRHPESPNVYLTLARYLNQIGRAGEAMWYIQSIYRRDPGNRFIMRSICEQHWQLWDMASALDCLDDYLKAYPEDLDARKWRAYIAGDWPEAIRVGEIEVTQRPRHWYPKMQLTDYLARVGEWQRIIELVTAAYPDLMTPEPQINDWSQWGARRLAEALLQTGQNDQAYLLIDSTLDHFERSRKLQAGGWMAGPEDALMLALLGEDAKAMDSLEQAIDRDWMFFSASVVDDTAFDHLRENPRFQSIIAQLENNLASERQWYQDHRNDLQL